MIRFIHPEEAIGTDFSPIAEITLPAGLFADRGVTFASDKDDLDQYDYAVFCVDGRGLAILQRYQHAPAEVTNLLVADNFLGRSDLVETLSTIAKALEIPPASVHWHQNGENVSLGAQTWAAA